MNHKTLSLTVLAATLLGAGTAQAATLDDAIRTQTRAASAAIQQEMRADLQARPYVLDVPGVEVGRIKLVDSGTPPVEGPAARPQALLETDAADISDVLRRDLVAKALSAPGMFGVYRYMTETALKAAIIVAE